MENIEPEIWEQYDELNVGLRREPDNPEKSMIYELIESSYITMLGIHRWVKWTIAAR